MISFATVVNAVSIVLRFAYIILVILCCIKYLRKKN